MPSNHIIAIHQPNYLPWLGYFFKIYTSDVFVFLDDVQYTKRSLTKRTCIRKAKFSQEKTYLTVPLQKHSDYSLIKALRIDHSLNWQRRQMNQLYNAYNKAPFFEEYFPIFQSWMEASGEFEYLADWNVYLVHTILELLKIKTKLYRSSEIPVGKESTLYLINIIRHLNGQVYFSGQGAKKYQTNEAFVAANIQLQYSDFYQKLAAHPYSQFQGNWINGLSIIDGLMNVGAKGLKTIFHTCR